MALVPSPIPLEGYETPSAEQPVEKVNKYAGPEGFVESIARTRKSQKGRRSTADRRAMVEPVPSSPRQVNEGLYYSFQI